MRIGILCAIPKEIHFFDLLPDSAQLVGGRTFFKSKHSSHDLVVVECGIGKVNAAPSLRSTKARCDLAISCGRIILNCKHWLIFSSTTRMEFYCQHKTTCRATGSVNWRIYWLSNLPVGSRLSTAAYRSLSWFQNCYRPKSPLLKSIDLESVDVGMTPPVQPARD